MLILNDEICSLDLDPMSTGSYYLLNPLVENWLNDNHIIYGLDTHWTTKSHAVASMVATVSVKIEFEKLEDEVAFKLRWL